MPRANEIKKGMVLNYNGKLLIVKNIDIQSPSARGAATLYKMRFSDVRTGLKVEERFKGDDIVDTVTLTRRFVDFSYVDGNEYVFMDKEDYTPYTFTKEQIEEELQFIPEGGMPDMQVLTWDGQLLALELSRQLDNGVQEVVPGFYRNHKKIWAYQSGEEFFKVTSHSRPALSGEGKDFVLRFFKIDRPQVAALRAFSKRAYQTTMRQSQRAARRSRKKGS